MDKKNKPVPAVIGGIIEKLQDNSINLYIRDNYCATLENIRDQCNEAIVAFNLEKVSKEKKRA